MQRQCQFLRPKAYQVLLLQRMLDLVAPGVNFARRVEMRTCRGAHLQARSHDLFDAIGQKTLLCVGRLRLRLGSCWRGRHWPNSSTMATL